MNPNLPTEPTPPLSMWQRVLTALRQPATLMALLAIGLAASFWLETNMEMNDLHQDLARRLADSDAIAKESRALVKQNQESLAVLQAKVAVLESRQDQAQSQQLALESIYQELSRSRDERLLAEIEQSLAIAAQQLQLAGNVEAALIALQEADNRLARAAQPQFTQLRKLIANDISRLRALPGSDMSGAALKLEGVIASIDSLPFAFEQRPKVAKQVPAKKAATSAPGFWAGLVADIWAELQQLIRIQRVDGVDPGLLAPNQAFFLRENLKLRLVNARLSMLARDGTSFREDMRQAQAWLEKYFDNQAKPVQTAVATVKALANFDVAQNVPSLNDTLNAVRNFRVPRSKN